MRTSLMAAFSFPSVASPVWGSALRACAAPFACLYLLRSSKCCLFYSLKVNAALAFHDAKTLLDQREDGVSLILQLWPSFLLTCLDSCIDLLNLSSVLIFSYQCYTFTSPLVFKQKQFCFSGSSPLHTAMSVFTAVRHNSSKIPVVYYIANNATSANELFLRLNQSSI